jgi:citrate synthase
MADKKFELTDLSSGKKTELPVRSGTIGPDIIDVASINKDHGVFTFDPGFGVTAATESKITYIDGDAGVLLHRGYPIEQLAEKSSFMEVAYLLLNGELPDAAGLSGFTDSIRHHTMINESLLRFFNGFHHNAHPMAMVSAVVASMSAFYHDSMDINNPRHREIFAHRIIAKIPTIAAAAHKHSLGQPFVYPRNDLDYCANMLNMFYAVPCERYEVDPVAAQALDLLFILHADHEQNASTSTVRLAGSTGANPYAAISAGVPSVSTAPLTNTVMRLAKLNTRSMSCSIIKMAKSVGKVSKACNTTSLSAVGTPAMGSSSNRTRGCKAMAIAISTKRCWP